MEIQVGRYFFVELHMSIQIHRCRPYRSFKYIKNLQRCDLLKIFVIPGGNPPTTPGEVIIGKRGDWHE